MISDYSRACGLIEEAERRICLLGRCQPLNLRSEQERLQAAWLQRRDAKPKLRYPRAAALGEVRPALAALAEMPTPQESRWLLLQERTRELVLEAELADAFGQPQFVTLAARRFPRPRGELAEECTSFVHRFAYSPAESSPELVPSDDLRSAHSLASLLGRAVGALRLPLAVRVERNLASTAAVTAGAILVREGVPLTKEASLRIAAHELLAHALPRWCASQCGEPLLRVGTAGATEGEEGRALLVEERLGLRSRDRCAELAWRHCVAEAVRDGAEWADLMRRLAAFDVPVDRSVAMGLRALRGGGLGRDLVYLPAYLSVRRAFAEKPALESWFECGRVGLAAAQVLAATGLAAPGAERAAKLQETCLASLRIALSGVARGPKGAGPSVRPDRSWTEGSGGLGSG